MIRARAPHALALLAAVTAVAGCGGGGESAGTLRWEKEPVLVRPDTLPRDRILQGTLRNDSLKRVDMVAKELRLLSADGRRIPASATFLRTFAHGLYPPTRQPGGREPNFEALRLGKIARVLPGKRITLTISWRQPPGTPKPVRIDWGGGSIPVPDKRPASP